MHTLFSRSVRLLLAIGSLVISVPGLFGAEHDIRPNVILILADDLGYGDVGFNGCDDIPTPNIDSLAADGVRFSSGYSSHPFCSPMRAGLMACRYQHRFGYVANVAFDPHNRLMGIPTDEETLPSRLSRAGYRTGMVGKWHLGSAAPFHPLSRGFDYFFGFLGGGHDYFVVDTTVQLNENYKAALDDNGTPAGLDGYLTDVLTDKAIEFIRQSDDKPYFAYVAYNAPHGPLQATEEKLQQFQSIQDKKRRTYAGMVSSMDDQIGRLLAEVDARGERENTLIIFLSDNGGPEHANASDNGPLRGQKGDVYEGGIRVPFVMRWTGTIPSGVVYEHPIISLDASCTALSVAGADRPETLDGVDLIPFLTGNQKGAPHEALYWMKEGHNGWAVRRGNEKLVYVDQQTALYDFAGEIGEETDLIAARPDSASELKASFESWDRLNQPNFIVPYRDYHQQLKAFHERMREEKIEANRAK